MGRLLILCAALSLVGCNEWGQTPEEMVRAAKVCRDGGLEVTVMEYLASGRRFVTCGAPVSTPVSPKPANKAHLDNRFEPQTAREESNDK